MESIIHLTNDQDLLKCPRKISEFIRILAEKAIEDESILFKVQGLDIIKPMLKESAFETSSNQLNFLNILHGLLIPYMNDPDSLLSIIRDVSGGQAMEVVENHNRYITLAHDFLVQLHESASMVHDELENQSDALDGIMEQLLTKKCIDEEQSEAIRHLLKKYDDNEKVDFQQFKLLAKLREELIEKELWQINQSEEINRVRLVNEALELKISSLEDAIGRMNTVIKENDRYFKECKVRTSLILVGIILLMGMMAVKILF